MNSEIDDKWQELSEKTKYIIEHVTRQITRIIDQKIQDIGVIEYYLDFLLDFKSEQSMELFATLCSYYEKIHFDNATFYWYLFNDTYGNDITDTKKDFHL